MCSFHHIGALDLIWNPFIDVVYLPPLISRFLFQRQNQQFQTLICRLMTHLPMQMLAILLDSKHVNVSIFVEDKHSENLIFKYILFFFNKKKTNFTEHVAISKKHEIFCLLDIANHLEEVMKWIRPNPMRPLRQIPKMFYLKILIMKVVVTNGQTHIAVVNMKFFEDSNFLH